MVLDPIAEREELYKAIVKMLVDREVKA
jgi:hypothetical protein